MELTAEERKRIYEEEKARIEAEQASQQKPGGPAEPIVIAGKSAARSATRKWLFITGGVVFTAAVTVALLLLLGSGKPSASDIRKEFEESYMWREALTNGWVRITDFDKEDGQLSENAGVKVYTARYSAWLEYLHPIQVVKPKSYLTTNTNLNLEPIMNMAQVGEFKDFKENSITVLEIRQPKDRELVLGEAVFTLYDSGWKLQSIKTTSCLHSPSGGRAQ